MPPTNRELTEAIRMARFEDIYDRYTQDELSCEGAADLLGCSVRSFYRLRGRYEEEGLAGLRDKRVGKASPHRAADEEVELVTRLYKERYRDFSVKHFHEYLFRDHAVTRSYSWTKNVLTRVGLIKPSKRGGPHRLRRPRSPMAGMMIHQDGSTHQWVEGQMWDLIVTMDDATSEIYSAFFVDEEGTDSSFRGISDVIEKHGIFCSFYTDRGGHYFYTPKAGGKIDKTKLTQVGRALKQLNIKHIPAYSPQARGRSERMFGTLQGRLPQEFVLHGIETMAQANRYMKEIYIPRHNKNFTVEPESARSAFSPIVGMDISKILCIQRERTVRNDNTVSYQGKVLQIKANEYRHHFVKAKVQINQYPDGSMALFYGSLCIGEYQADGRAKEPEEGKKQNKKAA